ncbi:hypothetical protein SAMN02799624_05224 [Paenibacillus sp. UNC496MF]|uniref:hypothetical protein n=1 Tax=Paenibacillus sp. UNC496MF TaxID=1502753 RepID=UPI0008E69B12|nr:hypothetical protein [Paenibacillus sp. UNC496MF]SFJ62426.1 hypothetical protein SAMN02799624_05224 [Paenibacillus sp. UNC496MF]
MEELYGNKGIDTPYEREQVDYHPQLKRTANNQNYTIDPAIILKIERAKDFTITSTLTDYDQLIADLDATMQLIAQRNQTDAFKVYLQHLTTGSLKDVMADEDAASGITGSGDTEIYTILYRMKASCQLRRDFVDGHYRTQITDRTDTNEIAAAEKQSIDTWLSLEKDFNSLSTQLIESYSDDEEEESDGGSTAAALEQELLSTEVSKKTLDTFHTTLADTSYVHRNRTLMFAGLLNTIRMIVQAPAVVMQSGMKEFILRAATISDPTAAKAHLMLTFADLKQEHTASKGQMVMIDDQKEQFVSRAQWMRQQIKTSSTHQMTTWLYNQSPGSAAFDAFAGMMVDSIQSNQTKYESSTTDMLKFYQQESIFYEKQLMMIQKKEQIRQFFSILEDLGEASTITADWVDEYVSAHGYDV